MNAAHCNAHKEFDYDCLDCSDALLAQRAANAQPVRINKRLEIPGSLYVEVMASTAARIRSRSDDCFQSDVYGPLADQYAQLFKSAPEMLHALRSLVIACTPDPTLPEWQNSAYLQMVALPRARAAIAQATGETP